MQKPKTPPSSEETIQVTLRLGKILQEILTRAVSEGKAKVVGGKIIFANKSNDAGNNNKIQI